jgi:hypothetical protein
MYQPFIFKLINGNSDVLDKPPTKNNLQLSSTINIPLISLGFHYFLHRTKNTLISSTNNLQTKNKFYYVINPFEHIIANYDDSLINLTKQYLNIKEDNPNILSRSFYKVWEILFLFNIADKKEIIYAALAESEGAFMQAIINYRQKLGPGITKDKIFTVPFNVDKGKYTEIGSQLLGYYKKEYPKLIKNYKTKTVTGNADISQIKTISLFKKDIEKNKSYADLITADGELKWDDLNYQEQEGYQLILGEIIATLRAQALNGHFILKIFETFTIPTLKLLYLLSSFYNETYIYKPFFSRQTSSEKYIICKEFKYDPKKDAAILNTKITSLENVLEGMNTLKYVYDIYPELTLPAEYFDQFKFINIKCANYQQIMINQIITYIKENNYFGEKYHTSREQQINATKWWVNNFYPPANNLYEKNKEDLQKILDSSKDKLALEQNKFISILVKT